jgi:hypothetical protein
MPVPRMRAGRFISFLAGLACAAALAGCDSNPSPAPLPSESPPSASPSATSTPSPTPPAMPAAAKGTDERSAKAFARHYVDSVNFAMRNGDTAGLKAVSSAGCAGCKAIVGRIEDVYSNGGRLVGNGWMIRSLSAVPVGARRRALISVGIDISPQAAYESPGDEPSHSAASRGNLDLHLLNSNAGWRVVRLDATQ